MKAKYYLELALMFGLVGGIANMDFGLSSAHAGDVPDVPRPECVDCGPGYHCNSSKTGCEPDSPPPKPDKPVDVPAPE